MVGCAGRPAGEQKAIWLETHGPGPPSLLNALSVFHSKLVLYGAFEWVRTALNCQDGGFSPGQCGTPSARRWSSAGLILSQ